ncbi:hypothetical protein RHSIM_Rhsim10G0038000 [Rhododendron simsii]|uniref:Sieve element occlusion N-terminal domain-containing protein n=1 Tax=Rhododendron simsii TaxID=118357 RepID=A0A834LC21_RHOSS|nr:hypothetical protein RHSIM_Rhsim10G0038000 [Rhododendron simsii]
MSGLCSTSLRTSCTMPLLLAGTIAMAIRRRREISLLTTSDDNFMMKQIMATHTPNGREFDVRPLLHVVEDVMHRATPIIPGIAHEYTLTSCVHNATQAQLEALDEKALHSGFSDMLELLPYPINRIAREISCKSSGGSDAHATTVALLNTLSSYMWDAKSIP